MLSNSNISATVAAYFKDKPVNRVWLFGSYVRGDADATSDIDVLVDIDKESNVGLDYFYWHTELANKLSKNVDGYRLSTFMHKKKDSDGGKLFMGPIWDFNLGFGNVDYCLKGKPEGLVLQFNSVCPSHFWLIPFWWDRLLEDTAFQQKLTARWTTLRGDKFKTSNVHAYIDSVTTVLNAESQQRNFQKWPVLGVYVWPNYYVGQTFQQEVDWLKVWVEQRMNWLDANIANLVTGVSENSLQTNFLVTAYPNPFQHDFEFEYTLERPGAVSIELLDVMGKETHQIQTTHDAPGTYTIKIGQTEFEPGMYFYKTRLNNGAIFTGKLIRQ